MFFFEDLVLLPAPRRLVLGSFFSMSFPSPLYTHGCSSLHSAFDGDRLYLNVAVIRVSKCASGKFFLFHPAASSWSDPWSSPSSLEILSFFTSFILRKKSLRDFPWYAEFQSSSFRSVLSFFFPLPSSGVRSFWFVFAV